MWKKSSSSGAGGCVEVNITGDLVWVRKDDKNLIALRFNHEEWQVFLDGVKAGEFDLPSSVNDAWEKRILASANTGHPIKIKDQLFYVSYT